MPEVDVPKGQSQDVAAWISGKINKGEGRYFGEDPEKKSRSRYEIDGEELSTEINTEYDIVLADLTEGHLASLAAIGIDLEVSQKEEHVSVSRPLVDPADDDIQQIFDAGSTQPISPQVSDVIKGFKRVEVDPDEPLTDFHRPSHPITAFNSIPPLAKSYGQWAAEESGHERKLESTISPEDLAFLEMINDESIPWWPNKNIAIALRLHLFRMPRHLLRKDRSKSLGRGQLEEDIHDESTVDFSGRNYPRRRIIEPEQF